MFKFLFIVVAIFALAIFPVMYTARAVDARNTSVWRILGALLLQGALSKLLGLFISSVPLSLVLSFLGGALIYQVVLDTTYKKGLIISVVSSIIFLVGALLLVGLVGGSVHMKA